MLKVTVLVHAPSWMAQGVKENLAMYLEDFGDAKVLKVEPVTLEDLTRKGVT